MSTAKVWYIFGFCERYFNCPLLVARLNNICSKNIIAWYNLHFDTWFLSPFFFEMMHSFILRQMHFPNCIFFYGCFCCLPFLLYITTDYKMMWKFLHGKWHYCPSFSILWLKCIIYLALNLPYMARQSWVKSKHYDWVFTWSGFCYMNSFHRNNH